MLWKWLSLNPTEDGKKTAGNPTERIPLYSNTPGLPVHLSLNRNDPAFAEQAGRGGLQPVEKAKLKAPVQRTDPTLKHPLVIFEFHQLLPKQTGCRAQNTPEDAAGAPGSAKSHGYV